MYGYLKNYKNIFVVPWLKQSSIKHRILIKHVLITNSNDNKSTISNECNIVTHP
jgi:hypothetical protein